MLNIKSLRVSQEVEFQFIQNACVIQIAIRPTRAKWGKSDPNPDSHKIPQWPKRSAETTTSVSYHTSKAVQTLFIPLHSGLLKLLERLLVSCMNNFCLHDTKRL